MEIKQSSVKMFRFGTITLRYEVDDTVAIIMDEAGGHLEVTVDEADCLQRVLNDWLETYGMGRTNGRTS